jgi:hypothetical protein
MLGRTSYHEGMLFLGLGMKQPRMNIVDATLILRKGEGGRGVYWKYKRQIRSSFFTYYGMAWSM